MGMDKDYMGWLYDAGGIDLYRFIRKSSGRNVVPVPLPRSRISAGWFKAPVKSWEDLKNCKCRETGITAEVSVGRA
jgi:TRAP-type mannitol/chloroaromatic compound transport system substrate-binding protein